MRAQDRHAAEPRAVFRAEGLQQELAADQVFDYAHPFEHFHKFVLER